MTKTTNNIHILDNVVPMHHRALVYNYAASSLYKIGFSDGIQVQLQGRRYSYLCSAYSEEDVRNLGLLQFLEGTEIGAMLEGYEIASASVNLSVPSNVNFAHTHGDGFVLLYYVNLEWEPHFYGETVFFNEDCSDIVQAVRFTPGRFVLFDMNTPHSIRPQSSAGPDYRFTLALMYKKKVQS